MHIVHPHICLLVHQAVGVTEMFLIDSPMLSTALSRRKYNWVHLSFSLEHVHLFSRTFNVHILTSHLFATSLNVVQHGVQWESSSLIFQPHEDGDGVWSKHIRNCFQICLV